MRKNIRPRQQGFTLVEMLVSIGITSVLMAAGFMSINLVAKSINRGTLSKILIETKANLVDSSLHPTALAYSISDPTNTSMECLRTQTDCSTATGGLFKLRNKRNELVYDAVNPAAGFGINGETCTGFSSDHSNTLCPFRYELTWTPICPGGGAPCDRPVIRISGQFLGSLPGESASTGLNAQRLSFSIMTSSGTTDLPYVKKEMVYLNRDTTATVDVLANSWSGTTNGTLSLTGVSTAAHGVTSIDGAGHLVYAPTSGFYGLDSAVITVHSNHGETSTSVVWFKVMTPFTWTGDANDSKWTSAGNWCGTAKANHSGCVGSTAAPGASDYPIFDGTCGGSCNAKIDPGSSAAVTSVKGVMMTMDFIGSMTVVSGVFRTDSDGFTQQGGNVKFLPTSSMVAAGFFRMSGGDFTAPSDVLCLENDMTIDGSANFIANAGTVRVTTASGTQKVSAEGVSFFNFDFANGNDGGWIDFVGTTATVEGLLNFHPWLNHFCAHFENGTLNAKGNVELSGCGAIGNGLLVLKGNPAGQLINGGVNGPVTNLRIEAGTNPIKFTGTIEIAAQNYYSSSYTYVSSGPMDVTMAKFKFTGPMPASITPGPIDYQDIEINTVGDGGDVNLNAQTMKVKGKLTLSQAVYHWCAKTTNGTFEAHGDVEISNCGFLGSAVLKIAGNAAGQLIKGSGGAVSQLRIESGANPLTFEGEIRVAPFGSPAAFTYVNAGAINWGVSVLKFEGGDAVSITPGNIEYSRLWFQPTGDGGSTTLNNNIMKVKNKVTFAVQTFHWCGSVDSGTLEVQGDVDIANDPACSTGKVIVKLVGNGSGQTLASTGGSVGNLRIDAGATPITINGILQIGMVQPSEFTYISAGAMNWSAGSMLKFAGNTPISIDPGLADYGEVSFSPGGDGGNLNLNGKTLNVRGALTFGITEYHSCGSVDNGTIAAYKSVNINNSANCTVGNVGLSFLGPDAATMKVTTGHPPTGSITVNKAGGASVALQSALQLTASGQTLRVASGVLAGSCSGLSVNSTVTIDPGAKLWDTGAFIYGGLVQNGTLGGCN